MFVPLKYHAYIYGFLFPFKSYTDSYWLRKQTDEWNNFLERVNCSSEEGLKGSDELEEDLRQDLRLWASYRGQTLTRTGTLSTYVSYRMITHYTL